MPTTTQIGFAVAGVLALGIGAGIGTRGKLPSFRSPSGTRADVLAHGYFSDATRPDSLKIVAPPPAEGSPAFAQDEAVRDAALSLEGTARYRLAVADADRSHESTLRAFQCALGTDINSEEMPKLSRLLAKVRVDVRAASYRAKTHYKRPRPYVAHNAKACAPGEGIVQDDGSYPSARGAVGWAYGLVLAEVDPARGEALISRGREFGQSRVVCDAEWQSDVDAGRVLATEVVKRMHSSKAFQSDLAAARAELESVNLTGQRPSNCAAEAVALASR